MVDVWKKKYLVIKKKIDELEEHNEYLSKYLAKIQNQIIESEAEKEMITVKLTKRKHGLMDVEPSHLSTPSTATPEHSPVHLPPGPPPLINMSDNSLQPS